MDTGFLCTFSIFILCQLQGAKKVIFTACHSGKLRLAYTSPNVISTSPKTFWWAELLSQFFCNLNSSKNFTCLSVTSKIAKSNSPVACKQALLFGRVKQVLRERSCVLSRFTSLAQIGERARRLLALGYCGHYMYFLCTLPLQPILSIIVHMTCSILIILSILRWPFDKVFYWL